LTAVRTVFAFAVSATAAQNPEDVAESVEAGRSDRRGWRLTVYFTLLVAVVAVAAAAATVYVFVQTDRDSRNAAKDNARFAAHAAASVNGVAIQNE